ncbi:hypothetical protein P3L10_033621 [Capsicum annuum]
MSKYIVTHGFNSRAKRSDKKRVLKNIMVTTAFVCEFAAPIFVNFKRKYTPGDIMKEMKVIYGVDINYMKA